MNNFIDDLEILDEKLKKIKNQATLVNRKREKILEYFKIIAGKLYRLNDYKRVKTPNFIILKDTEDIFHIYKRKYYFNLFRCQLMSFDEKFNYADNMNLEKVIQYFDLFIEEINIFLEQKRAFLELNNNYYDLLLEKI